MLLVQLTGLSGAGKTTIAYQTKAQLLEMGLKSEVIDGDEFRSVICRDLGFSKQDRMENIERLGFVADILVRNGIITLLAAINPYELSRKKLQDKGGHVKTVWVHCELDTLIKRDTKGLYKKALLPDSDPEKLHHFSGISDPYEVPSHPDLIIETTKMQPGESSRELVTFILASLPREYRPRQQIL